MYHRRLRFNITLTMFVTLGIPDEPVSAVIDRVRRTATGSLSEREWSSEYGRLLVRPPKTGEEQSSGVRRELPASQV